MYNCKKMGEPDTIKYMRSVCGVFVIPMPLGIIECLNNSSFDEAVRHSKLCTSQWSVFVQKLHTLRNKCAWNIEFVYACMERDHIDDSKLDAATRSVVSYMSYVKRLYLMLVRYGDNINTSFQFVSYWINPVYTYASWEYVVVDSVYAELQMCTLTVALLLYLKAVCKLKLGEYAQSIELCQKTTRFASMGICSSERMYNPVPENAQHVNEYAASEYSKIVMLMSAVTILRNAIGQNQDMLADTDIDFEQWMDLSTDTVRSVRGNAYSYVQYNFTLFTLYTKTMAYIMNSGLRIPCVENILTAAYDTWIRTAAVFYRILANNVAITNGEESGRASTQLCTPSVDVNYTDAYMFARCTFQAVALIFVTTLKNTTRGSVEKLTLFSRIKKDAQVAALASDYLNSTYCVIVDQNISLPPTIALTWTSQVKKRTQDIVQELASAEDASLICI